MSKIQAIQITPHSDQKQQKLQNQPQLMNKEDNQFIKQKIIDSSKQKIQQIKEIDYYDPQIKAYFQQNSTINTHFKSKAQDLTQQKILHMKQCIVYGVLNISENNKDIGQILKQSSPIKRQQKKLEEYLQQKLDLANQLKKMEELIRKSNRETKSNIQQPDPKNFQILSIIGPQQHRKFMSRISKIKKQNQQRKRINLQYEQAKIASIKQKEEETSLKKKEELTISKRDQLKQRLNAISKRRQKQKQDQSQALKRFKSVSQQKRLHQLMEEKYHKSILLPSIEQKNKILQERTKKLNSIRIQQIKQYERQYLKNLEERQQGKKDSQSWHYQHPPYNSKMIKIIQQENMLKKIKAQEQKQKHQQLKNKRDQYKQYLKQRLSLVKIDQKKRLQIQSQIIKQKSVKNQPSKYDIYQLGNKYLSQAKSRIKIISKDKKDALSTKQQSKIRNEVSYKAKSSTSMGNYSKDLSSSDHSNKSIDNIISSEKFNKNQKLQKLRIQIQKLGEKAQRKSKLARHQEKKQNDDDIENLLSSIKAKVSIIELYKK